MIRHGGYFKYNEDEDDLEYIGGEADIIHMDFDKLAYFELVYIVKEELKYDIKDLKMFYMEELKAFSQDAYDYLSNVDPHSWSRSGFSPRSRCDLLTNNVSESFNKWILSARERNIVGMADLIRRQLMRRMQQKRENLSKFTGRICPRILKKIENFRTVARKYGKAIYAGSGRYEVSYFDQTFTVDIVSKECGCRMWQLSGIPCVHGMVALIHKKVSTYDDYVDPYYYIENYFKAYEGVIEPIPDCSQWPRQTGLPLIEPPIWKQGAGRPKKARKKDLQEMAERIEKMKNKCQLSKLGQKQKCRNCFQEGHNRRVCTNETVVKEKKTGKGGRPPKHPNLKATLADSEDWRKPRKRGRLASKSAQPKEPTSTSHGNPGTFEPSQPVQPPQPAQQGLMGGRRGGSGGRGGRGSSMQGRGRKGGSMQGRGGFSGSAAEKPHWKV